MTSRSAAVCSRGAVIGASTLVMLALLLATQREPMPTGPRVHRGEAAVERLAVRPTEPGKPAERRRALPRQGGTPPLCGVVGVETDGQEASAARRGLGVVDRCDTALWGRRIRVEQVALPPPVA